MQYGSKIAQLNQGKAKKVVQAHKHWFPILEVQIETRNPILLFKMFQNGTYNWFLSYFLQGVPAGSRPSKIVGSRVSYNCYFDKLGQYFLYASLLFKAAVEMLATVGHKLVPVLVGLLPMWNSRGVLTGDFYLCGAGVGMLSAGGTSSFLEQLVMVALMSIPIGAAAAMG